MPWPKSSGPVELQIVLRAAFILRIQMGLLQKGMWFWSFHSILDIQAQYLALILHLLFISDPRRSLSLSDLCDTHLSPLLGVSLASPLPLVMPSHCQIALDKLIFLSLHFLGVHLCHVPGTLSSFLFVALPACLVQPLYPFPGPLCSPSSQLFPCHPPTQSTAAVTATTT